MLQPSRLGRTVKDRCAPFVQTTVDLHSNGDGGCSNGIPDHILKDWLEQALQSARLDLVFLAFCYSSQSGVIHKMRNFRSTQATGVQLIADTTNDVLPDELDIRHLAVHHLLNKCSHAFMRHATVFGLGCQRW